MLLKFLKPFPLTSVSVTFPLYTVNIIAGNEWRCGGEVMGWSF